MAEIRTYPDADSLARAAAGHFIILAAEAIAARGLFSVALSGGSTPRATYALLSTEELSARLDWSRVHVFWGDERCVPPDHPDSNYRMAREALLDHVPLPVGNVHRIRSEINPEEAAADYERTLHDFFARHPEGPIPRFDLILLGDGARMDIPLPSFPVRRCSASRRAGWWHTTWTHYAPGASRSRPSSSMPPPR